MSKKTLAPGFKRAEFRPGIAKFPGFQGIDRQSDPGAIAPNRFYQLQNVRIRDGEIVSRGGLSKVRDSAENGCIVGLFDNLEPNMAEGQTGLFFTDNSNFSADKVRIGKFIDDTYTDHYVGSPNGVSTPTVFCSFGGNPFVAVGTKGYTVESGGTLTELFTLAANPNFAIEHDGDLYLIIDENSTLVKWDGASITTETNSIGFMGALYSFSSELYVAGAASSAGDSPYIRRKSTGYAALSFPGAVVEGLPTSGGVTFGSKHYTGWAETELPETGDNVIISIEGTTLTVERRPSAHNYTVSKGVRGLCTHSSQLVFVHNSTGGTVRVGTYDGASWTDTAKNLTTQVDIATDAANNISSNDGFLYVSEETNAASPARQANLVRCATPGGSWTADVVPADKFDSGIGADATTNPYPIVSLS